MKKFGVILFFGLAYFAACVPAEDKIFTDVNDEIQNSAIQSLYDFQDKQIRDSIYPYFRHPDPSFRHRAVLAFSSFKDVESLDSIASLLLDPIPEVRIAAAYTLGQIGDSLAEPKLIQAFNNQDTIDINNPVQAAILEAIGKCGTKESLAHFSQVSTYKPADNHLLLGLTKGIYRFALRGMTLEAGTEKMIEYLSNDSMPESVRFIAANYLFRAKDVDVSEHKFQLARVFSQHKDPRIRMALARPIAKTSNREVLNILLGQLSADDDYRVKCNIVRELGEFEYIDVVERILRLVNHENEHISNTAADYLLNHGNPNDALLYLDYARDAKHWLVRAKIYQAVMRHLPAYYTNSRARIRNEIIQKYTLSENDYEKAALVKAIAEDFNTYPWIRDNALQDSSLVVRMSALSQLGEILTDEQFDRVFTGRRTYTRNVFVNIIKEAIATGDAGLIALASGFIQDEKSRLKNLMDDVSFLEEAKQKLEMPRDVESYQSLQAAISYLNESEPPKPLPVYTANRINWSLINELSDSSRAFIYTTRGKIGLKFNYKQTPGTVANFIKLAEEDFFDGKVFHRVVPNFVIQGGCPRGDGYGSLDYTIRSELSSGEYSSAGKVGMASAGNHTECTQWFITHSPTPHLDGNYSLFAEVVSGMDVVHKIQVGDVIEDVRILKL